MFHQQQFNCNQSDLSDTSSLAKVWTYVYSITTVSSPDFLFFRCLLSVLTACNHHRRHINDLCFQLMSIKYPSRRGNINGATYFTMSLKQTKYFLPGHNISRLIFYSLFISCRLSQLLCSQLKLFDHNHHCARPSLFY